MTDIQIKRQHQPDLLFASGSRRRLSPASSRLVNIMVDADAQYSLLSSTRYDDALLNVAWNTRVNGGIPSRFMLLPYHFDRLAAAAEKHGWITSRQHMESNHLVVACDNAVNAARPQYGDGPLKVSLIPPAFSLCG